MARHLHQAANRDKQSMEPRLIFEANKTYQYKISWNKPEHLDSEWIAFKTDEPQAVVELIEHIVNYLDSQVLHVSIGRHDSETLDQPNIRTFIEPLLNEQDFAIWDEHFKKVIDFNKIGVYRLGIINT